ncbi:unnamed protein product [Scytosiphon promiscuus]
MTRRCTHEGCSKAASFGFPNEEPVACSAHKRPGHEYLPREAEHHRGRAGDSLTQAMGHVPKGLDYRHFSDKDNEHGHHHSTASDNKHCRHAGCMKAPSYGWTDGPAVMCALHKRPTMVYLRHPSRGTSFPSSGNGGQSDKLSAGMGHVPKGLEYVPSVTMERDRVVHSDHPHCAHKDCTKAPSYGTEGQGGMYCFSHKRPGQIFLKRGAKLSSATAATTTTAASTAPVATIHASARPDNNPKHQDAAGGADKCVPAERPTDPSSNTGSAKEGGSVAVEADMAEARRCVALSRQRMEDVTVGTKYLSNIRKHPDDLKYRMLKISNRKFYTEVWLNDGMRGVFLALGFRKHGDTVVLDPLTQNTLDCVAAVLQASGRRIKCCYAHS